MFSLRGRTLLVAGLGGIGSQVARMGVAMGMRVHAIRASAGGVAGVAERVHSPSELLQALTSADVIINTLPLTETTRGLFGAQAFGAMKRGAVFINVARGASVDTEQLSAALASGRLAAAGLDVTEPEPLPSSHPLWKMRNVIITPHVAGWGTATRRREWLIMRENLRRYCAGEPLISVVDPGRGY
jgi:phosphoglycerate dehydrogenase-like enzyme